VERSALMSNHPNNASTRSILAFVLSVAPLQARILVLALAGIMTVLLAVLGKDGLSLLEEQAGAMAWKLNPDATLEERVSIIAIDEKSLAELGPWPWPRETLTALSDSLADAGVQLQVYDIVLPEQRPGDATLAASLMNNRGLLGQAFALQSDQLVQTGQLTHPLQGLVCNAQSSAATGYVANNPAFADIAKGHITPVVDSDGAVRKVPAYICNNGRPYPALALGTFLQATGDQAWNTTMMAGDGWLDPAMSLQIDAYPGLSLPVDAAGHLRVPFRKAPEAFIAYSAVDVINGLIAPELLENTWVLVGYTAFGLDDIVPTPFNGAAPGVEIQARLIAGMLDGNLPYTPRASLALQGLVSLVFAGALLLLLAVRERFTGLNLLLCVLLLPALSLFLHTRLLLDSNIWFGWINPALYGVLAASLLMLYEYSRIRMEKGRVLINLSSYLPSDVAHEIAFSLPDSSINAQRVNATILNADLRNFSAYGEARLPEEAAALLHFFFVKAAAIIEANKGQVHEFKGDGLLAVWHGQDQEAAALALKAAIEMQQTIQEQLPQIPPPGLEPLALGIGIETGSVLIGSIGPANRRTHTLLGETVTVAMRVQEMTAELAQPVLLGENAAKQLQYKGLESQGSYLLDGLRRPHILYAPPLRSLTGSAASDVPMLKVHQGGRA
jgi:adenylate cyclase